MTFRFLPPAEAELRDGILYYAAIRPELGARFETAVSEAVRNVVDHPERGAVRTKNTRRRLVNGFPYAIVYRSNEHGVLIVAVAHQRKEPDYWTGRTG